MKIINNLWTALVALIKLTDKVDRLEDTVRRQQQKIESENERLIRLETALQLGALKPSPAAENPNSSLPP